MLFKQDNFTLEVSLRKKETVTKIYYLIVLFIIAIEKLS